MAIDPYLLRQDFPIFGRTVRDNKRLVYLDNGATSHKPEMVIQAEADFYRNTNAAVHRGAHHLAEEATESYEEARDYVAEFLGAKSSEVIFTKNATEALNLLAYAFTNAEVGNRFHLTSQDRIVVTEMEHHANLIPWQQLAKRSGAHLGWFNVDSEGRLDLSNIDEVITESTKVVALTHQSNVLGTINPLKEIIERAHKVGAVVVLDACQSVPHMSVNVSTLGVDFLAFSGHKSLGPTGVGILWGRSDLLEDLPPFLFGGSMIETVTMTGATWAAPPTRFEAGVPNMAQAAGLSAALKYLSSVGLSNIHDHEMKLTGKLLEALQEKKSITVFGPKNLEMRGGVVSFAVEGIHPHDLGQFLDSHGIAVRTGHHCAWPLNRKFGVAATTRASFYLYNTDEDVSALLTGIDAAEKYFGAR